MTEIVKLSIVNARGMNLMNVYGHVSKRRKESGERNENNLNSVQSHIHSYSIRHLKSLIIMCLFEKIFENIIRNASKKKKLYIKSV